MIIHHFVPLYIFLTLLIAAMSESQQRHALIVVGALPVCASKYRCLTTLRAMLRMPHADHFALAFHSAKYMFLARSSSQSLDE
jgi:hypothetical protein